MPCFQGLLFQAVVVIVLKPVELCGDFGFRQLQNHLQAKMSTAVFLRSTRQETGNGRRVILGSRGARLPSGWIMKAWQYPSTETFLISPAGLHTVLPAIRIAGRDEHGYTTPKPARSISNSSATSAIPFY